MSNNATCQKNGALDEGEVDVTCDCGDVLKAKIYGDEGQLLVWNCPKCGLKRDVNA